MLNHNDVFHSQEVAPTQLNELDLTEITMTNKVTKLGKNTQPAFEYTNMLYLICNMKLWHTNIYFKPTLYKIDSLLKIPLWWWIYEKRAM